VAKLFQCSLNFRNYYVSPLLDNWILLVTCAQGKNYDYTWRRTKDEHCVRCRNKRRLFTL